METSPFDSFHLPKRAQANLIHISGGEHQGGQGR